MYNKNIKGKEYVVAEGVSSKVMRAITTRNAEAQGHPGLVSIGKGKGPSNKATTIAKYAKAQSLGHS